MLRPIHSDTNQESNTAELKCPRCQSLNLRKVGKERGKQEYLCNECKRQFIENPQFQRASDVLPPNITPEEMFEFDIWDLRVFGLKPNFDGRYTLNFSTMKSEWLKIAVKHWLKYRISIESTSTICMKLTQLKGFAKFIESNYSNLPPQQLNRNIIVDYLVYLTSIKKSSSTRAHYISSLSQFLDDSGRFSWANVPKERLIYLYQFNMKTHTKTPPRLRHP
ncbi:hypothetical protein BLD44_007115 [Mastigocladus laminosus UU774]|nr:hypothetical protein BLD44_007115 [Mastigocladus laminosus UU774]